jgi:hypothetical protein
VEVEDVLVGVRAERRCLGGSDDALVGGLMTQGMRRGCGHDMCQDLVERKCVS